MTVENHSFYLYLDDSPRNIEVISDLQEEYFHSKKMDTQVDRASSKPDYMENNTLKIHLQLK